MKCIVPQSLETPRLQLRMLEEKDLNYLYQLYSDPECVRYTLKIPLNQRDTWRTLAAMLGHWHLRGYGPYAVVEKQSDKTLGVTGLWYPLQNGRNQKLNGL